MNNAQLKLIARNAAALADMPIVETFRLCKHRTGSRALPCHITPRSLIMKKTEAYCASRPQTNRAATLQLATMLKS